MNKLVGYTVLVLGTLSLFLIIGLFNTGIKDIVYEVHGVQFECLEKNQAIDPTNVPHYFASTDSEGLLTFFMYPGHWNEEYKIDLSVYKTSDPKENLNSLSFKAVNNQLNYTEYKRDLDKTDMVNLLSEIENFKGLKLSKYNYENGFFGYIDDTPIIFIFFTFGICIICLLKVAIDKLLMRFIGPYNPSSIILFTYFIFITNLPLWFPYSDNMNSFRKIATVVLPYFLFQFIKTKSKKLSFPDREIIKFFTIIIGTFTIGYILSCIGYAYDSRLNNNIMMTQKHGPHPLIMGFTISIAAANLLANLVLHMIQTRNTKKVLQKTNQALGTSSANLESLQSSINPHFLHNALNSIASTAKQDGEKTEQMAVALSQFYSYVTNRQGKEKTILLAEEEMLENYLQIEKIRFGDKIDVSFDIGHSAHQCHLPRMLLQPIVENAIKYGYSNEKIQIKIEAKNVDKKLTIKIYDSGPDFTDYMQMGFGIKSVSKKLQALYPNKYELEFNNAPSKHVLISIDQK